MGSMNVGEMRATLGTLVSDLSHQDGLLEGFSRGRQVIGSGWEADLTHSAKQLAAVSRSIDVVLPGMDFGEVLGTDALTLARKGARLEAFHEKGVVFDDWRATLDQPIRDIESALNALSRF